MVRPTRHVGAGLRGLLGPTAHGLLGRRHPGPRLSHMVGWGWGPRLSHMVGWGWGLKYRDSQIFVRGGLACAEWYQDNYPPDNYPPDNYPRTNTPQTITPLGQIPPGHLPPPEKFFKHLPWYSLYLYSSYSFLLGRTYSTQKDYPNRNIMQYLRGLAHNISMWRTLLLMFSALCHPKMAFLKATKWPKFAITMHYLCTYLYFVKFVLVYIVTLSP